MKFCSSCGNQVEESASFCPNCGASLKGGENQSSNTNIQVEPTQSNETPTGTLSTKHSALFMAGYVFAIIGCVLGAFEFLLPLAWMLPMTINLNNVKNGKKPLTTTFAVCDLIFLSLLSGIFLLCCDEMQQENN